MRSISAALLLSACAALTACGDNAKQEQAEADKRAAGFVPPSVMSRLDYGSMVERRFHALDRDGDNMISADELPRQDSRLTALDKDKDGHISSEEWSQGMMGRFDRLDANRDGSLTSDERAAEGRMKR